MDSIGKSGSAYLKEMRLSEMDKTYSMAVGFG